MPRGGRCACTLRRRDVAPSGVEGSPVTGEQLLRAQCDLGAHRAVGAGGGPRPVLDEETEKNGGGGARRGAETGPRV